MNYKLFLVSLTIFLSIDFVWLTVIASNFYQENIGFLLTKNPNLISAGIFYILFVFGLSIFVIKPALVEKSRRKAVIYGGLFGLVCYATYDLTNLATIANWPLVVTIVDMIWGTFISSTTALLSFMIFQKLNIE